MSRRARSFRFREELLLELAAHAPAAGLSPSALAERYVDEGLRHESHPLIVFRDGRGGRRASLAGTRLDVAQVVETARGSDSSSDAAEYLGIPTAHVEACINYYLDYRNEIDAWIEHAHAFAEEQEEVWRQRQEVFA